MPFDLTKLSQIKTIVVHGGGCPDGVASAILLHDALPDAEVKFIQYQTPEQFDLPATSNMLFCDITPHAPRTQAFVKAGALVLDHHKTAKDVTEAFGPMGVFGDEKTDIWVCGAVLAYRHVWRPIMDARYAAAIETMGHNDASYKYQSMFSRAEKFANVAGVRDLWLTEDPRWKDAVVQAEVLRFYPTDAWLAYPEPFRFEAEGWWGERLKLGAILVDKHGKSVERAIDKAWRFVTKAGTRVIMFEGPAMTSDAAEVLDKDVDLVIGFGFVVENSVQKMIFSTRSHTGYDCAVLAKSFGGGGHTAAAGFNVQMGAMNPYAFAELLVGNHEEKRRT